MATICFYQDSRHAKPLYWIRRTLGFGYIAKRNDGMTELRINSFVQVHEVLKKLLPYFRFKRLQTVALRNACATLMAKTFRELNASDIEKVVSAILKIQKENYQNRKKKTKKELYTSLGLTP